MATYIKTLKEDNGDITYPQTTADAVLNTNSSSIQGGTVQTFLNKAVVAEEIASTGTLAQTVPASIIDWSSMPIAQKASFPLAVMPGSVNINATLTRYGNLVICHFNSVATSGTNSYDEQSSSTLPLGYRPAYNAIVVGNMSAGGSQTGCFDFTVYPTGTVEVSCPAVSGATRVQGLGVWWTTNDFPTS